MGIFFKMIRWAEFENIRVLNCPLSSSSFVNFRGRRSHGKTVHLSLFWDATTTKCFGNIFLISIFYSRKAFQCLIEIWHRIFTACERMLHVFN